MAEKRWWQKWWIWLIGAAAVLLAGTGVLLAAFHAHISSQEPFAVAAAGVADAPAVRYEGVSDDGTAYEVRSTASGDATGSFWVGGDEYEFLFLDGRGYLKPPAEVMAGPRANKALVRQFEGRWSINEGASAVDLDLVVNTPVDIANQLRRAVLVSPNEATEDVDPEGRPALALDTSVGRMYVSRHAPHQLLHVSSVDGPPAAGTASARANAAAGMAHIVANTVVEDDIPAEASDDVTSVEALGLEDLQDLFDLMSKQVEELKSATDPRVSFDAKADGDVSCKPGACTTQLAVTTSSSAGAGNTTSGKVVAELVANFTVQGRPSGHCRASNDGPLNGPLSIGCSSPEAGAVFGAAMEREAAQARARADACGCKVSYEVPYTSAYQIVAKANIRVQELRTRVARQRENLVEEMIDQLLEALEDQIEQQGDDSSQIPITEPSTGPDSTAWPSGSPVPTPSTSAQSCRKNGKGWQDPMPLGPGGRATGFTACVTMDHPKGSPAQNQHRVPGYKWAGKFVQNILKDKSKDAINACHLLPNQLGGSGKDRQNLATCTRGANSKSKRGLQKGGMFIHEQKAAAALNPDTDILYTVMPVYEGNRVIPKAFYMIAYTVKADGSSSRQLLFREIVMNDILAVRLHNEYVNIGLLTEFGKPAPIR